MKKTITLMLLFILVLACISPAPVNAVTAKGHWRIHQDQFDPDPATDLHFTVWQREHWVEIWEWNITTSLDGNCTGSDTFTMSGFTAHNDSAYRAEHGYIINDATHAVDCEFWAGAINYCCWVEIDAEFELTSWNTIRIRDIEWTTALDTFPDDFPDQGWDAFLDGDPRMVFTYYNDDATRDFELRALRFYTDGTGGLSNTNIWNWSTWNYTAPSNNYWIGPGGHIIVFIEDFQASRWLYFVAEIWAGGIKVADVRGQHEGDVFLAVSLASFEAIGFGDRVEIKWATASEIDNAGFNIYRSTSRDGEMVKVNDVMIPARGDEISGAKYSYMDSDVSESTHYYWFEDVSLSGGTNIHGPAPVSRKPAVPTAFKLAQNYPNPFNPYTEISYDLPHDCHVILEVYNVVGQRIVTLVDGFQTVGQKVARWDGRDVSGLNVASGVYFYQIKTADFSAIRKMILLR